MKEIQINEFRELQMQILDYIDFFCRSNNINYTLSGGTLLGAVRHGGYLPWDDDIDIQMLRDEYDRFTSLWNNNKEEHPYEFISIESGNGYGNTVGKVCNPKTVLMVRNTPFTGVFVDVFPVDNVLDLNDFHLRHDRVMKYRQKQSYLMAIKLKAYNNILQKFLYKVRGRNESLIEIAKKINDIAKQRNNDYNCPLLFEMVAGSRCKEPFAKEIFSTFIPIQFENRKYMSVKDYDSYLKATFGDYMTLPPIEKRVRPHRFIAYWK